MLPALPHWPEARLVVLEDESLQWQLPELQGAPMQRIELELREGRIDMFVTANWRGKRQQVNLPRLDSLPGWVPLDKAVTGDCQAEAGLSHYVLSGWNAAHLSALVMTHVVHFSDLGRLWWAWHPSYAVDGGYAGEWSRVAIEEDFELPEWLCARHESS